MGASPYHQRWIVISKLTKWFTIFIINILLQILICSNNYDPVTCHSMQLIDRLVIINRFSSVSEPMTLIISTNKKLLTCK
jgi:hypothetical protein